MNTDLIRRLAVVAVVPFALAACGDKKEGGATQVAAKVNKGEVTVHQINFALQRANVPAEQVKDATRQVLDRLVEQELLVQAATEKKLDRDPKVVQSLEAARRDVLARAYLEQVAGASAKPTDAEVKDYYAKNPALFAERRIYSFRELTIAPGSEAIVKEQLEKSPSLEELAAALKGQNIRFAANQFVKPAEQLPLDSLNRFHTMKDGQISLVNTPQALVVLQLAGSRSEPVDEARARPMIEQFLGNKTRGDAVKNEVKRLKDAAKIEFMGEFAKAPAPAASAPTAAPQASEPAAPASAPAADLEKGLKGL